MVCESESVYTQFTVLLFTTGWHSSRFKFLICRQSVSSCSSMSGHSELALTLNQKISSVRPGQPISDFGSNRISMCTKLPVLLLFRYLYHSDFGGRGCTIDWWHVSVVLSLDSSTPQHIRTFACAFVLQLRTHRCLCRHQSSVAAQCCTAE